MTTIRTSENGAEFVQFTVTESTGLDLTTASIEIGLSRFRFDNVGEPLSWSVPENVSAHGPVRVVRLLVNSTLCPTPGRWDAHVRITDGAEIVVRVQRDVFVTA